MYSIRRFLVQITSLLVLLMGIYGGEIATYSLDWDNSSELSMEMEKEIQEETQVDWFVLISNESSKKISLLNPVYYLRNVFFFPCLHEKALDNPPEPTV